MQKFIKFSLCLLVVSMAAGPKKILKSLSEPTPATTDISDKNPQYALARCIAASEVQGAAAAEAPLVPDSVIRYTNSIKIDDDIKFNLLTKYAQSKLTLVKQKASGDNFCNHMLGRLVTRYTDAKGKKHFARVSFNTEIFKDLYADYTMPEKTRLIDWTSSLSKYGSDEPCENCFFINSAVQNGHSEEQFVSDYSAIWKMYPGKILDTLVPYSASTIHFAALQLFSTFDSCDSCLSQLTLFKRDYLSSGQQSLKSAIDCFCQIKDIHFRTDKANGLLIFNSALAYNGYKSSCTYECINTKSLKVMESPLNYSYSYDWFVYAGKFSLPNPARIKFKLHQPKVIHIDDVISGIYSNIQTMGTENLEFTKSKIDSSSFTYSM